MPDGLLRFLWATVATKLAPGSWRMLSLTGSNHCLSKYFKIDT